MVQSNPIYICEARMEFEVKSPLLGFEEVSKMKLIIIDDVFMKLQAKNEEEHPIFTLVNPYALREYKFDIPDVAIEALELTEDSNISILNIVVVQDPISASTVNFAAPIIFNTDNNTMIQIILDTSKNDFGIAEPISSFMTKNQEEEQETKE